MRHHRRARTASDAAALRRARLGALDRPAPSCYGVDAFNRAVLDFLTAVDAGRRTRRNPASLAKSAILPESEKR